LIMRWRLVQANVQNFVWPDRNWNVSIGRQPRKE